MRLGLEKTVISEVGWIGLERGAISEATRALVVPVVLRGVAEDTAVFCVWDVGEEASGGASGHILGLLNYAFKIVVPEHLGTG